MIMGGMVLETNLQEIVSRFQEQQKIAKSEVKSHFQVINRCLVFVGEYNPVADYGKNFQNFKICPAEHAPVWYAEVDFSA